MPFDYKEVYGVTESRKNFIDRLDFESGVEHFGEQYGFKSCKELDGLRMAKDIARKNTNFENDITKLGRKANLKFILNRALEDKKLCSLLLEAIRDKVSKDTAFYYAIADAALSLSCHNTAKD